MAFAILKLSYNQPGEPSLTGGVCGTGFFIDDSTALTAHHVLSERTFAPNAGFRYCGFWILSRSGQVTQLDRHFLTGYPEIDTTVLKFDEPQSGFTVYAALEQKPEVGAEVRGFGYIGNEMPQVGARWEDQSLFIAQANLNSVICDRVGHIMRIARFDVNAQDVKLENVAGYEISFGTRIGMSGGPFVNRHTRHVLGLLSFGLPPDAQTKTQTFAVAIDEILQRVRG